MKMSNYQVKTEKMNGLLSLLITHNGNQQSGLRIVNPEYEIPKIIEVLKDTLKKESQKIQEEVTK